LDLRIGERLGFGMALALVVVAQQIVTSGMMPISDQRLWLDKFVAWSFYWVLFGVIQSVLIGFLFYIREDRQAHKENRRLSMMNTRERESMMRRVETGAVGAVALATRHDEEEIHPLTTSTQNNNNNNNNHVVGGVDEIRGGTEGSTETMESGGGGGRNKGGPSPDNHNDNDNDEDKYCAVHNKRVSSDESCLYSFSLRKMDLLSLFFAAITYSVFIAVMVSTASNGLWLTNEPDWFDETSTIYNSTLYDNSDPNN